MSVWQNLEKISAIARHDAKQHGVNYNVILINPDANGEFNAESGSSYGYVTDSFFEKERPNVKLLFRTDDDVKEIVESNPVKNKLGKPIFFLTDTTLYDNPTAEFERRFCTPIVRTSPKIGRNDPCTCGSGKKYKNCFLQNACK